GSLDNQSSVMEYIDDVEAVDVGRDHAGPYDIAAIRFLYGLSPNVPTSPFCTDEDTLVDPDCATFDTGAEPLVDSAGPNYLFFLDAFLGGLTNNAPNNSLNGVEAFVRAGTEDEALTALQILGSGLFEVDPAQAADPDFAARVDFATNRIWQRMYL